MNDEAVDRVSQLELVSAIFTELDRQGFKSLNTRQMNACVTAANELIREVERGHKSAVEGMTVAEWLKTDDTGLSSKYMASVLCGFPAAALHWPHDPGDFGRCHRFMKSVLGTRERIGEMSTTHPVWAALVAAWAELELLYEEEHLFGSAPKLYKRMREAISSAEQPKPRQE